MNRPHINTTKKPAFTMIELVFIIVILGILAAIAIPKVSASRIDAKAAAIRQDIGTVIQAFSAMTLSQAGYMVGDSQRPSFDNVATINKKNWVILRSGHPHLPPHMDGDLMYSTLAVNGGVAKNFLEACVVIETMPHAPGGAHYGIAQRGYIMVEVQDTPVCNKISPPESIQYPFGGKDVKF